MKGSSAGDYEGLPPVVLLSRLEECGCNLL